MSIPTAGRLCERSSMNAANHGRRAWRVAWLLLGVGFNVAAQSTDRQENAPARSEPAAQGFDESAFRIVSERNIFNANRSGGQARLPSRRPTSVEAFTLVGTMDYEKGTFAFFEGSSSQLTKVMKANDIVAGHKLVTILPNSVKLEADGQQIELPVGWQMRREDEGPWQVAEPRGGLGGASNGDGDSSNRSSRSDRDDASSRSRRSDNAESSNRSPNSTDTPGANEAEVLKRLMERREKESQ